MLTRDNIIRKDYTPQMLLETLQELERVKAALWAWRTRTMEPGYEPSAAELQLLGAVWRDGNV